MPLCTSIKWSNQAIRTLHRQLQIRLISPFYAAFGTRLQAMTQNSTGGLAEESRELGPQNGVEKSLGLSMKGVSLSYRALRSLFLSQNAQRVFLLLYVFDLLLFKSKPGQTWNRAAPSTLGSFYAILILVPRNRGWPKGRTQESRNNRSARSERYQQVYIGRKRSYIDWISEGT